MQRKGGNGLSIHASGRENVRRICQRHGEMLCGPFTAQCLEDRWRIAFGRHCFTVRVLCWKCNLLGELTFTISTPEYSQQCECFCSLAWWGKISLMSLSAHSYPVTWPHRLLFIFALLLSILCPFAKCESQPDGVSNACHTYSADLSFGYSVPMLMRWRMRWYFTIFSKFSQFPLILAFQRQPVVKSVYVIQDGKNNRALYICDLILIYQMFHTLLLMKSMTWIILLNLYGEFFPVS